MIRIITDSTAGVSSEYAAKYGITVVPLTVHAGGKTFYEGTPDTFDEIFEAMLANEDTSKSSQPPPESFKELFDKFTGEGDEVIAITISSSLSGTYNSARLASTMSKTESISVIDSKGCAQLSLLQIEEACEMVEKGFNRAEIVQRLYELQKQSQEIFVPVTLKHLIRGGRIGTLSGIIGTILSVKPMLVFSNGVLSCKKRIIGMQKAIKEIIAEIPQTARKIYVMYIHKSDYFSALLQKVTELFPSALIRTGSVSPVVGVHVGPGTIGISYCN